MDRDRRRVSFVGAPSYGSLAAEVARMVHNRRRSEGKLLLRPLSYSRPSAPSASDAYSRPYRYRGLSRFGGDDDDDDDDSDGYDVEESRSQSQSQARAGAGAGARVAAKKKPSPARILARMMLDSSDDDDESSAGESDEEAPQQRQQEQEKAPEVKPGTKEETI